MNFYKCRFKWAHGFSDWKIVIVHDAPKEFFDNMASNIDSDKFRGIEWTKLKSIPREFIELKINLLLISINNAKQEIKSLSTLKTTPTKKSCLTCAKSPKKDCSYAKGYYKTIGKFCSDKQKEQYHPMW